MIKLSAVFIALSFLVSSWMSSFSLPRLFHSPADYVLMPFMGYLSILLAAQLAARLLPGNSRNR